MLSMGTMCDTCVKPLVGSPPTRLVGEEGASLPLGRLLGHELAIDAGSESIKVLPRGGEPPGGVVVIPSLVARAEPGGGGFLRSDVAGEAARLLAARAEGAGAGRPGAVSTGVAIRRPILRGAVADVATAARLFEHVFQEAPGRRWGSRPRVLCGVGAGTTVVEQQALAAALESAGARRVRLVPSLAACALTLQRCATDGANGRAEGSAFFVMEMGTGRTGFGLASSAGVLAAASIPIGSRDIDRALAGQLRRRGLVVTESDAGRLRRDLGLPAPGVRDDGLPVRAAARLSACGRCPPAQAGTQTGDLADIEEVLPRHVGAAAGPFLTYLADEVRRLLARSPVGAVEDLLEGGLVLAGGPAATPGLAERLAADLALPVRVAPDPANLAVTGLALLLEEGRLIEGLAAEF